MIPVGSGENQLQKLLEDLEPVAKVAEVMTVKGSHRACQLNEGARKAERGFLWFLHADSRIEQSSLESLLQSLNGDPEALHYFDLRFLKEGPSLMRLNEIGCRIRSRLMDLPFGDQGFSLSRENFERIGGFPEEVPYGEDHVFVWRARQNRIRVRSTNSPLQTSARKYREQGWWRTTRLHWQMWRRQARPEREKLKRIEKGRTTAVAIFVKTPGRTPLKTRLAETIGGESALEFYELCLETLRETLTVAREAGQEAIFPYWGVAEKEGLTDLRWKNFGRVWQGEGDLGEKLHRIYSMLQPVHKNVVLLGADAPQLSVELILKAHELLRNKNRFVVGPARDGGFYLFGGSMALPKEIWTSVAYSRSDTLDQLLAKIRPYGEISSLPTLSDVDHFPDLPHLLKELDVCTHGQKKIRDWIASPLRNSQ